MLPLVGPMTSKSISIVVVLPAPFGPSKPNISPVFSSKEILSTAVKSPNFLVRFLTSKTLFNIKHDADLSQFFYAVEEVFFIIFR